jgi:hypothetical protein
MKYKKQMCNGGVVSITDGDGRVIPMVPGNRDYDEFCIWEKEHPDEEIEEVVLDKPQSRTLSVELRTTLAIEILSFETLLEHSYSSQLRKKDKDYIIKHIKELKAKAGIK